MRRKGARRIIFPLSAVIMGVWCISSVLGAQTGADSCLDCHTHVDRLKKITLEHEKKKPRRSAETSGEG
jgi:hypothetical protein